MHCAPLALYSLILLVLLLSYYYYHYHCFSFLSVLLNCLYLNSRGFFFLILSPIPGVGGQRASGCVVLSCRLGLNHDTMCGNSLGRNTCTQLRNMQLFSWLCLPLGAATPVNLRTAVLPFPRHLRTQNLAQKLREVYVGVMSEHCFSHTLSFDLVCIPNHSCLKDLRVINLHKK